MTHTTTPRLTLRERLEELKVPALEPAIEIAPRLWRVRTRGAYSYLALDDDITLIDTGSPGSGRGILEAVRALGRSPAEIRTILITHYHFDHVGGLAEIQQHVSARAGIHVSEAPAVESDMSLPNPFMNPILARLLDPYLEIRDPGSARIDLRLRDGDELPGLGGIRVIHTPGHTPGSISLHFRELGAVLVGDALQYRFGQLALPNRLFTQDMDEAIGSIRKLARCDFETLCFSHYRPIEGIGDRELRKFVSGLLP